MQSAERDPWPTDPKPAHLRFLRWLAERDLLEHPPLGPPTGRYAERVFPWILPFSRGMAEWK
jgi:hypothetical protein